MMFLAASVISYKWKYKLTMLEWDLSHLILSGWGTHWLIIKGWSIILIMSSSRSGGVPYSFGSFKSNQSYENYQPTYFGIRTNNEPKMFGAFNSSGFIPSHVPPPSSQFKMFPTSTSINSTAEDLSPESVQLNTFKNIMLVAAANKWTEKDISSNWDDLSHLLQSKFQGTKREIQKQINYHKTPDKRKRSRSQQLIRKLLNPTASKQLHQIHHSPKLQRFHSLNHPTQHPLPRQNPRRHRAKSVEQKHKRVAKNPLNNTSSQQKLLRLCQDIEGILHEGEKRLI